jgi:hypothetical protein
LKKAVAVLSSGERARRGSSDDKEMKFVNQAMSTRAIC